VKESKERERVAIASWDEERQRALREDGRVVELRAERAQLRAQISQLEKNCTDVYDLMKKAEAETKFFATTNASLNAEVERLRAVIDNPGDVAAQISIVGFDRVRLAHAETVSVTLTSAMLRDHLRARLGVSDVG